MTSLYDKKFYSKARSLLESGKISQLDFDVLPDICKAIDYAYFNGTTFLTFCKQLEPILNKKGWLKKIEDVYLNVTYHLETIFRTNVGSAYASVIYKQQVDNANYRPYWQYISVIDKMTRPSHDELHGKVFRFDDIFWNTHYPQNGYNCRCRIRALTEKQVKARGLTVEFGTGNMVWEDKKINENISIQVAGYNDQKDGNIIFTDPWWSFNPGKIELSEHIIDHVLCLGVEPKQIE